MPRIRHKFSEERQARAWKAGMTPKRRRKAFWDPWPIRFAKPSEAGLSKRERAALADRVDDLEIE